MKKDIINLVPGYKFYKCPYCGMKWEERSRDCHSPSGVDCDRECCKILGPMFCYPSGYEEHPEWDVDMSGNLV